MADSSTLEVYMYLIMIFATIAFILFVLMMIAKKVVGIKLNCIFAKRKGMIMVNYTDEKKMNQKYFSIVKEKTVRFTSIDGMGKILGIDPQHIQYDASYDIMRVDCNPVGSYLIDGNEAEQSILSPELADKLFKKQALSPDIQNEQAFFLKVILICVIAICAVMLVSVFLNYDTWKMAKTILDLSTNSWEHIKTIPLENVTFVPKV